MEENDIRPLCQGGTDMIADVFNCLSRPSSLYDHKFQFNSDPYERIASGSHIVAVSHIASNLGTGENNFILYRSQISPPFWVFSFGQPSKKSHLTGLLGVEVDIRSQVPRSRSRRSASLQ